MSWDTPKANGTLDLQAEPQLDPVGPLACNLVHALQAEVGELATLVKATTNALTPLQTSGGLAACVLLCLLAVMHTWPFSPPQRLNADGEQMLGLDERSFSSSYVRPDKSAASLTSASRWSFGRDRNDMLAGYMAAAARRRRRLPVPLLWVRSFTKMLLTGL